MQSVTAIPTWRASLILATPCEILSTVDLLDLFLNVESIAVERCSADGFRAATYSVSPTVSLGRWTSQQCWTNPSHIHKAAKSPDIDDMSDNGCCTHGETRK